MDDDAREQALLTALTTEHFVLQTSRSATITESVGRATVFLSLLPASLIGLGFVSSSGHLIKPYLGAVLPTLVITGLLTFGRLVQKMVSRRGGGTGHLRRTAPVHQAGLALADRLSIFTT